MKADFAVRNIGLLATLAGPQPRLGASMRDLGLIERAAVASAEGRIVYAGSDRDLGSQVELEDATVVDAEGGAVIPGLVDAHTHLAFAGNRDDEIRKRLAGVSYREIAEGGGGIVRTVAATRSALKEDLVRGIRSRLDEMLLQGTTTVEIKSGYGLTTEAELRSLEAIREADLAHPMAVVPTFLGAHEVPVEMRDDRGRYLEMVCQEMIPEVARRRLATFCDVFCEKGVFSVAESRKILETARDHGLKLRLHADELTWTGGAELAGELGARSADHLVFVSGNGMKAMAKASCVATLLPSAAFYLRLPSYAPARELIDAGTAVALASDANPGGGLSPSLPFAMTVACFGMGMSLEEALSAATVNAACSLELGSRVGSLEIGKQMDLLILRSPRLLDLLRVGVSAIRGVVKGGKLVVKEGRLSG
jgi:imidazolonepropionase